MLLPLFRVLVVRWGHLVRIGWRSVWRLLIGSVLLLLLLLLGRLLRLRVVRGGEFFVGFLVFVVFVAFVGGVGEHGEWKGVDWFGGGVGM